MKLVKLADIVERDYIKLWARKYHPAFTELLECLVFEKSKKNYILRRCPGFTNTKRSHSIEFKQTHSFDFCTDEEFKNYQKSDMFFSADQVEKILKIKTTGKTLKAIEKNGLYPKSEVYKILLLKLKGMDFESLKKNITKNYLKHFKSNAIYFLNFVEAHLSAETSFEICKVLYDQKLIKFDVTINHTIEKFSPYIFENSYTLKNFLNNDKTFLTKLAFNKKARAVEDDEKNLIKIKDITKHDNDLYEKIAQTNSYKFYMNRMKFIDITTYTLLQL